MSGLEQAIRNALERAERSDPDIRARIYQSARNALDLGLRKQEIVDPDVIGRQRQRLEATIREIEDEELARLRSIARFERVAIEREPEAADAPAVESEPRAPSQHQAAAAPIVTEPAHPVVSAPPVVSSSEPQDAVVLGPAPRIEPDLRDEAPAVEAYPREPLAAERDPVRYPESRVAATPSRVEPRMDDGSFVDFSATRHAGAQAPVVPVDAEIEDAGLPRGRRLGSFFVSAFVYLFLFGIVGGAVWWVEETGMIDAALKGSSDFQLVPEALSSKSDRPVEGNTRLDTLRGFSGEWINIYKPGAQARTAVARSKASIDQDQDSDGLATVITSNAPDQDGDVLVEVPASLLQDLAGKTSTIAVTVKSNTDKPAQIYVRCEFGTLGDCGRHRYTVTNERADELIQVTFDGKMAPSTPGHIVINSDVTGEGASIRLYGIRVLPGS